MTEQEKQYLEDKLVAYESRKLKLEASIRRYESMIEELMTQLEKHPEENELVEELAETRRIYEVKKLELNTVSTVIYGIEWLLEK